MSKLKFVFEGQSFRVPRKYLTGFLEHHQELSEATSYAVQSSVPLGVFELFVDSLKAQERISVRRRHAASLSLLADEFFLPELAADCAAASVPPDPISIMSDRIGKLELQVSSFSRLPRKIEAVIESQEQELENLRREVAKQRELFDRNGSSSSHGPREIDQVIEAQEEEIESLRLEVAKQTQSFSRELDRVVFKIGELDSQYGQLGGNVKRGQDETGREIGKLKSDTEKVARSVSVLETLKPEVDRLKVGVKGLQEGLTRVETNSKNPGVDIRREFENLRGEIQALKGSLGGDIGKLKSETEKVARSVSVLETLKPEVDRARVGVQRMQQDFGKLDANFKSLGEEVERLRSETATVAKSVSGAGNLSLAGAKGTASPRPPPSPSPLPTTQPPTPRPSPLPSATSGQSQGRVDIRMQGAGSLDGIISYLTKKHGGNVTEKRIVSITAKSVDSGALKLVAELSSNWGFQSANEPGQWICWDFLQMRARLTHYTIRTLDLKSWIIEGSVDGTRWTEIDRRTGTQDFKENNIVSFAISRSWEFRLIRLTQTEKNHHGHDRLCVRTVEFFGTLLE
jgi:hypothetical protein